MYVGNLLSRNFVDKPKQEQDPIFNEVIHVVERVMPISEAKLNQYQDETSKDQVLSKIKHYVLEGWPKNEINIPRHARWAWKLKDQIEVKEGILLLDGKIMIPKNLQREILTTLHKNHFGIVKTKKRARQAIYWKGMSAEIEALIRKCNICERLQPANTKEPLLLRDLPLFPFESVAADICTYGATEYLIVACNKTRWLDILPLKAKTAGEVIEKLKVYFANHGIPRVLMSDNMPFASKEFKAFAKLWGIEQAFSSPRYPRSNGFAEKMVGVAKMMLKKSTQANQDLQMALLVYRNSPIEGMPYSPAQLAMARMLRTTLPTSTSLLKHKVVAGDVELDLRIRDRQQKYYNQHARMARPFNKGDSALLKRDRDWEPVVIREVDSSPRSYIVTDHEGQSYRRNRVHLRKSLNAAPIVGAPDEPNVEENGSKQDTGLSKQDTVVEKTDWLSKDLSDLPRTRCGRPIKRPSKLNDYCLNSVGYTVR